MPSAHLLSPKSADGKSSQNSSKDGRVSPLASVHDELLIDYIDSDREDVEGSGDDRQSTTRYYPYSNQLLNKLEQADGQQQDNKAKSSYCSWCCCWAWLIVSLVACVLAVYHWPVGVDVQMTEVPERYLPELVGPLALNDALDTHAERLFDEQLWGPESLALDSRGNLYTGVEGGFILYIDTQRDSWLKVATLNGNRTRASIDLSDTEFDRAREDDTQVFALGPDGGQRREPCWHDARFYGPQAYHVPGALRVSRCSRPLGIRVAPNDAYLYVVDSSSGLYRVDLLQAEVAPGDLPTNDPDAALAGQLMRRVTQLYAWGAHVRHKQLAAANKAERIVFADDMAVVWSSSATAAATTTSSSSTERADGTNLNVDDVVYITDCSSKWHVRDLFHLILEHDTSGRVLELRVATRSIRELDQLTPVRYGASRAPSSSSTAAEEPTAPVWDDSDTLDTRRLSFPNGIELIDNNDALLIADLNNRRIVKHWLRGDKAGATQYWASVAGYPDNIRRGAQADDTYWVGCGCAIHAHTLELAEAGDAWPRARFFASQLYRASGSFIQFVVEHLLEPIGLLSDRTRRRWVDYGVELAAGWRTTDLICRHGIVVQYDAQGRVIDSLHAPHASSHFKYISEARELLVPAVTATPNENDQLSSDSRDNDTSSKQRVLYLGSVYNNYLGRIQLA